MGKIAFVFAGQGSQYTGMGKDLYENIDIAKDVFDEIDQYRKGTSNQCFLADKEELNDTLNTQPCVFAVDLACANSLLSRGIVPDVVAGFSLGEIAALTFCQYFDMQNGTELVINRATWMAKIANSMNGSMLAVMKMDKVELEKLAEKHDVYPVNYNSPTQTVVAGEKEKIIAFASELRKLKKIVVPLNVSGAFHTPYMKEASDRLYDYLYDIEVKKPIYQLYSNMSGEVYANDVEEIKKLIAYQASNPVRWQETIEHMIDDGVDVFYEVGPGKTLTGLIKQIARASNKEIEVYSIGTKEELENVKG